MNNLRKFQQLLNEGISQQDLADTLCARLETRYPDIYNKYDYDTVYRAVDDVASFHAGAEELGTSDIGMMLRSVIKRLEEYQGVAEGSIGDKIKGSAKSSDYSYNESVTEGFRWLKKPWMSVVVRGPGSTHDLDTAALMKLPMQQRAERYGYHGGPLFAFANKKDAMYFILKFGGEIVKDFQQGVAEGSTTNIGSSPILQKVVDAAAKYGFKMSNRSKNGQKIILQNNDFHQWMTCRIRNINGKIYIDYDESSNINGLRNEVVTPNEFIQRLKNYYLKGQAWLEKIRKRDAAEKNFVGIRVEQYPYGKPSSGLRAAVKFLNRNGKRGHEYFDFPEYADIPDEISNQLMPEEVDFIQDRWDEVPAGKQGAAEGSVKTPKITFAQKIPGSNSLIDIFVDGRNEFLAAKIGTGIWSVYPIGEGQSSIGAAGSKSELKKKVLDYLSKQGVAEEQLDELKCWDGYKRVPGTKSGAPGSCEKINELSTEKLAQYKKAAGADASKADKEGNFERGNKRFSGIVKATKKQFDNETKPKKESAIMKGIVDETLGTPYPGTYEQENKPFMRKGPKRTMKLTTEGKNHVRR